MTHLIICKNLPNILRRQTDKKVRKKNLKRLIHSTKIKNKKRQAVEVNRERSIEKKSIMILYERHVDRNEFLGFFFFHL